MTGDAAWFERDDRWQAFEQAMFGLRVGAPAEAEVEGIVRMLALAPGSTVLDIPCGVGRHSIELARRGLKVTGVDRTRHYLDRAERRAREAGVTARFLASDMREFSEPGAFDAAINYFTSFGYFDDPRDDRKVLDRFFGSLRPGGRFLIETLSKEILARSFRERDWYSLPDGSRVLEQRRITRNWTWIESKWTLLTATERFDWDLSHRIYSAAELSTLMESCGFRDLEVYGSIRGTAYDHAAERMVILARRPGLAGVGSASTMGR